MSTAPNGDIVSGDSDGVIRVFSEAEKRWATELELKEYDAKVASQALPSQQMGDVKKSDLPGLDALGNPGARHEIHPSISPVIKRMLGKKSGEVKMIRNGDNVEAYQVFINYSSLCYIEASQWDSIRQSWEKIGDVVDAIGQGRKQLYQGKEYDYVFDVDIKDGAPPLKLPYNVTGMLEVQCIILGQLFISTRESLRRGTAIFTTKRSPLVIHRPGRQLYRDEHQWCQPRRQ